jgi:hypothetical protein
VLPKIMSRTRRLKAAHLSNLLFALGKLRIRTGGVFPLQVVKQFVVEVPYMSSKQLATATMGLSEWPLSQDLVNRAFKPVRAQLKDYVKHDEIQVQEVWVAFCVRAACSAAAKHICP